MTARKPTRQKLVVRRVVVVATVVVTVVSLAAALRGESRNADAADRAADAAARPLGAVWQPRLGNADVYAYTKTLRADVATDLDRVYVPSGISNVVTIIDPVTRQVVGSFASEGTPQHIVPSYDLRTLWVLNNKGDTVVPDRRAHRASR